MKWIKYELRGCTVMLPYNQRSEEIARNEADNGVYTVEEAETSNSDLSVQDVILDTLADTAYRLCVLELGGEKA